jgi:hypothetical protein
VWLYTGFGFVGLFDTTRDHTLHATTTHILMYSVTVSTNLLVTASKSRRFPSFRFSNWPRASATATVDWLTNQLSTTAALVIAAVLHHISICTDRTENTTSNSSFIVACVRCLDMARLRMRNYEDVAWWLLSCLFRGRRPASGLYVAIVLGKKSIFKGLHFSPTLFFISPPNVDSKSEHPA